MLLLGQTMIVPMVTVTVPIATPQTVPCRIRAVIERRRRHTLQVLCVLLSQVLCVLLSGRLLVVTAHR